MKLFPIVVLMSVVVLVTLSCKSIDLNKRYPNMVANVDPISAGVIEAEFDRLLSSKLDKRELQVFFYPRLNAVVLEYRYQFVTYRQFWDETNRKKFAVALERYKEEYAARKLGLSYSRSKAAYGKINAHVEWQAARYSQIFTSFPVIEIGYRFKDDSPFFATLMRSAREVRVGSESSSNLAESQQLNMYFTRAQAEEVVKLFDQNYLMELLNRVAGRSLEPIIPDTYYDEFDNDIDDDTDISDDY
jgi:hypothetical protein